MDHAFYQQFRLVLVVMAYVSIAADHVHPFMATIHPSEYIQHGNVPYIKATGSMNMTVTTVHRFVNVCVISLEIRVALERDLQFAPSIL